VTLSLFAPGTIYQDVAHRLSRSRKKMRAISERRILGSDQPQPGLMHQGSRLKRLAGSLLCHLRRCQMPQFIVNQFKQFGGSLGVALLHRDQQNSSLAHALTLNNSTVYEGVMGISEMFCGGRSFTSHTLGTV